MEEFFAVSQRKVNIKKLIYLNGTDLTIDKKKGIFNHKTFTLIINFPVCIIIKQLNNGKKKSNCWAVTCVPPDPMKPYYAKKVKKMRRSC